MTSFFWVCLLVGGGVVVLQFAASLLGLDHGAPHDVAGHGPYSEGLHLFTVRSLSAGMAFLGVGGLAGQAFGWPSPIAALLGLATGTVAAIGVAALMRGLQRLDSDRTFKLANAIGQSGDVYLTVPEARSGVGKIHITIGGRLMELEAITSEDTLPTGARVLVVDTIAPATVIVVPQPRILEEDYGNA